MVNTVGSALGNICIGAHPLSALFFYSILPIWCGTIVLGLLVECISPVTSRRSSFSFNIRYMGFIALMNFLLTPAIGAATAVMASYAHGGWISLPQTGFAFGFSILVLLAAKDFLDYWVHRAQHRYPILWKMHSFHHSDPAVNLTTAQRHFWLERPVFTLAIYPLVGILFHVTPALAAGFSIGGLFWSFFPHMNLRLSLGKFSPIVLGPQVHRLHHSILAEHYDCNYAGVFPLWDVIFGTYRQPRRDEFPETGVADQQPPQRLLDALLWPIKRQ